MAGRPRIDEPAKTKFAERLRELYPTENYEELASRWKCSRTTARSYLNGDTSPSAEVLESILTDHQGLNLAWLVSGSGSRTLKQIPEGGQPIVVHFRHNHHHAQVSEEEGAYEALIALPVLKDASAAGPGRVINESDVEPTPGIIHRDWCPHPDKTDYVRVHGDSMEKTIPDGSLVTIDKTVTDPRDCLGKVAAVYSEETEEVTIKRIERHPLEHDVILAVPDNLNLVNLPFRLTTKHRIVGIVRSVHAQVK